MPRDDEPVTSEVEWLDIGASVDDNGLPVDRGLGRSRWPRWTSLAVALALMLVVAVIVTKQHKSKHAASPSTHPATSSPARPRPTRRPPRASIPPPPPSIVATKLGHPLLGITGGYELFGRGPEVVVRIQPALGRITRTVAPGLSSGGPVSFLVEAHQAMVRPWDAVAGYVVPDGRPAAQLPASLDNKGGVAMAGPDPGHMWLTTDDGVHQTIRLTALDGRPTGESIRIPDGFSASTSDGAGYVLSMGIGGVYDARPDGLHRITSGVLVAVGPTRWLTVECDDRASCATFVIDRATGARHALGSAPSFANAATGLISPDGSTAAVLRPDSPSSEDVHLHLVDLADGSDNAVRMRVSPDQAFNGDVAVWSPDSRWLFVAGLDGRIVAIDPATRHIHDLGVRLPAVQQIAIRSQPS